MEYIISPIQFLQGLSYALELSSSGLSNHQWRVSMVANSLAEAMGLPDEEGRSLIYAALIHDIGAVSDWDGIMQADAEQDEMRYLHAEAGYEFLKDSRVFGNLAPYIRYHHDAWNGHNPSGLSGEQIPLISRIIHLADTVVRLLDETKFIFLQNKAILAAVVAEKGKEFDPALVDVLERIAALEGFWLNLVNTYFYPYFFKRISRYGEMRYSLDDIIDVSEVMAAVIDINDPFTGAHSRRVAAISEYLAKKKGFSADEVKITRIAGLLHDLGKLAIPKEILEKPDALTEEEFAVIKQHPYYTYCVFRSVDNFQRVAEWAAFHHETLDGKGYPFRIKGDSLPLGARIVAVADIFTALTEKRAYHADRDIHEVGIMMSQMVDNHKIDGTVVDELFRDPQEIKQLLRDLGNQDK